MPCTSWVTHQNPPRKTDIGFAGRVSLSKLFPINFQPSYSPPRTRLFQTPNRCPVATDIFQCPRYHRRELQRPRLQAESAAPPTLRRQTAAQDLRICLPLCDTDNLRNPPPRLARARRAAQKRYLSVGRNLTLWNLYNLFIYLIVKAHQALLLKNFYLAESRNLHSCFDRRIFSLPCVKIPGNPKCLSGKLELLLFGYAHGNRNPICLICQKTGAVIHSAPFCGITYFITFFSTSSLSISINSPSGIIPLSPSLRQRTETAFSPCSFSPTISIYGIFSS